MMNKTQRGLGRGLDALFSPGNNDEDQSLIISIPIKKISPNKFQPRRVFDEEALQELASSITQYGILQPIVLRKALNGYELVAGERRWRGARLASDVSSSRDRRQSRNSPLEHLRRQADGLRQCRQRGLKHRCPPWGRSFVSGLQMVWRTARIGPRGVHASGAADESRRLYVTQVDRDVEQPPVAAL